MTILLDESFRRRHPFVLEDGRRFSSLESAADSLFFLNDRAGTVTLESVNPAIESVVYTWDQCRTAVEAIRAARAVRLAQATLGKAGRGNAVESDFGK